MKGICAVVSSFNLRADKARRVDEEEIEKQTDALRAKLTKESERNRGPNKKELKMHQVHELAEAKIKQDDRFRSALGISKNYEEGSHWRKQEEKLRNNMERQENNPEARSG
jgi:hypothetical protein